MQNHPARTTRDLKARIFDTDYCAFEASKSDGFSEPIGVRAEQHAANLLTNLLYGIAHTMQQQLDKMPSFRPSLCAIIDDQEQRFDSLEDKIEALENEWRQYNAGQSVIKYDHFSYYQIIGCGPFAVPALLQRVKDGSNAWFVALKAIAGTSAETEEMRSDPKAARQAWVEWGAKYNYGTCAEEAYAKFKRTEGERASPRLKQC